MNVCRTEAQAQLFVAEGMTHPAELPRAVGCTRCRGTDYRDRLGVFDAVDVEGPVADSILSGAAEGELRTLIRSSGTPNLVADGLPKVADGLTTL